MKLFKQFGWYSSIYFRNILFISFVLLLIPRNAEAGHIVGSEISYKWISGNSYEITLTIYRDCGSPIPAPNNPVVRYSSATCGRNNNVTLSPVAGTGIEITHPCSSATTTCNGGTALGIQKYVYTTTVTLPAQCSDWVFGFDVCCRNCDITTVATPGCSGAPGTYVAATLNNIVAPTNSSPVFTNLPMSVVCIGQPFQYNNGVVDVNGDSLVYSFINPQQLAGTNVSYLAGYSAGSFLSSSPGITVNGANGDITINATTPEISIFAVLVKEYRNGVLVGSVIRDVQVWTTVCTNSLPSATGINATTNFNISACAGTPVNFFINSSDANPGQTVTMTWNNGIPGATFTTSGSPYPTGQFSWTPTLSNARSQPYTFSVTVQDNACPRMGIRSYSYSITVASVDVVVNSINSPCAIPATGTATAVVTGSAPITYLWTPGGSTGSTATGLAAGTYTVIATESHGCSATATVVVNAPTPLTTSIAGAANVTCNAANDGSIAVSAAGGVAPYSYNWIPTGGTGASASNLSAGTYTITVTDANSCTQIIQSTISQPTALNTTAATTAALCNGNNNGMAAITATGGLAPYTYFWSPGGNTTNAITVATAGNYTVTVTDASGCTKDVTLNISQPLPLNLSVTATSTTCSSATGTATANATGGNAPYTYQWSTGSSSWTIGALAAGGYSITVVDANGCTTSDVAAVSNISGPTLAVASVTSLNCNGDNNGSATVSVLSGVNPLTYQWSPSGGTLLTANGLSAGTYSLTVRDGNNCVSALSIDITEPPALSMSITPINPTCSGFNNGTITTIVSGGIPPYNYSWTPGGNTGASLINIAAGNYQVLITDRNGCTYSDVSSLTQPAPLSGSVTSSVPVSCSGGNNGEATVSATGGTSPYDYTWSPSGGNMVTAAGLSAGNFSVTVTDANNCTTIIPVNITQPMPLATSMNNTQINCNGAANGAANVSVTGGIPPYDYSWTPAVSASASAINLIPGSYSVIVTDANECSISDATVIGQPSPIVSTLVSVSNVRCFGSNNGSGSVSTNGGVGPYTYSWSPSGGNSSSASGLSAGMYTITMTDANQCTISTVISINQPAPLIDSACFTNITCNGLTNGSAYITTTGTTGPYTYLWNTGETTSLRNLLTAGSYSVTVTDATGCTATQPFNITQPFPLIITPATIPSTCGNQNGAINVSVSGGTLPYNYLWSQSGATTASLTGLSTGAYDVQISDSAGCISSATLNVVSQAAPQLSVTSTTNVLCNNNTDGSATVTATGGTGTLQYQWSPSGGNSPTANGLSAGTYSVLVTDANNCTLNTTVTITQPAPLNVTTGTVVNINCFGGQNGQATVIPSGGTGAYQYLWSPSNYTSPSVSALTAGTYTVTVTDANACMQYQTLNISQPAQLLSSATAVNVSCNGGNDGAVNINTIGGLAPYSYAWNPAGNNTPTRNNLSAGSYSVTITDGNGCTVVSLTNINQPSVINVTSSSTGTLCGQSQGSATLVTAGGNPPYNYLWIPGGMTTPVINNLTAGSYTVVITDSKQCSKTTTVGISNSNGPVLNVSSTTDVSCNGGNNGRATVNVTIGAGQYVYQWTPTGGNASTATNLPAGNYLVQVADVNQCITSIPVVITEPPALSIIANATAALCNGSSDGNAVVNISGGIQPYQYNWSSGATTSTANNLSAGTYSIRVSDSHGCVLSDSVSISEPTAITLSTITTMANCNAQDGSANVIASGGSQSFTYQWTSGSTSPSANSLGAGNYLVTVTDSKGCTAVISAIITERTGMTCSTSAVDAKCFGAANGSATVQVTGGVMPLTYNWLPAAGHLATANNLQAGSYTVNAIDANGCLVTSTVSVGQPADINANITAQDARCAGSSDGQAVANITGGLAPYTYLWNTGANTNSVNSLATGNYTLIITDANGCIKTSTVSVNSPADLIVAPLSSNPICIGQQITLSPTVSGGTLPYNFSWLNGPQTAQYTVSPVVNTNYNLKVIDANGCTTTYSNILVPVLQPLLFFPPVNATICEGENVTLNVQASGGTGGPYSYTWNNGMTGKSIMVSPTNSTTYRVTTTDNCTLLPASIDVPVIVNPKPIVNFTPSTFAGCTPVSTYFTDQSNNGSSYSYIWNFGDGTNSTGKNATHLYTQPGDYAVSHTVTDNLGCSSTLQIPAAVHVYPLAKASFTYNPGSPANTSSPIIFSDESLNAARWLWNFGDGLGSSNEENPVYAYNDTGEYTIRLISISNKGCIDTTYRKINVYGEFNIYIPNAFTPNSDNTNDKFIPVTNGTTDFDMYIFDRWGLMIYHTKDINSPWNGKVNGHGTDCQNDVYVYKILVKDLLDKKHEFVGSVTLVK